MEKGFTIIEIVISISILSVAIIGVFTAFSIINILTSDSVDKLTAIYLAQEGIEIVRNIRDTNWLNENSWVANLNCSAGCEADYTFSEMQTHTGRYLCSSDGAYAYGATCQQSKFKRKITITPVADSDHIIKVVVEVSWDRKATVLGPGVLAGGGSCSGKNCIKAEEILYNWYQ